MGDLLRADRGRYSSLNQDEDVEARHPATRPAPHTSRTCTWARLAVGLGVLLSLALIFHPQISKAPPPSLKAGTATASAHAGEVPPLADTTIPNSTIFEIPSDASDVAINAGWPQGPPPAQASVAGHLQEPPSAALIAPGQPASADFFRPATGDSELNSSKITAPIEAAPVLAEGLPSAVAPVEPTLPGQDTAIPASVQSSVLPHKSDAASGRKLHFLLPATKPTDHLCKLLFTAAVNGYPSPVLINFGLQPELGHNSVSHLKKISGVSNYLQRLGPDAADDLVLITDAFDVWFQLPMETLISRYRTVLDAERLRIAESFGPGALDNGISPKIVFAADKGCYGYQQSEHWCWLQPESPLAPDIYGDHTDTTRGYGIRTSFRPRWLNSGVAIGPVSEMLALFQRTEAHLGAAVGSVNPDSDQRILELVYAQQQLERRVRAAANPGWMVGAPPAQQRTAAFEDPATTDNLERHPEWRAFMVDPALSYEFGITVDYNATMSMQTAAADHEYAFLLYNGSEPFPSVTMDDPRDCRKGVRNELPQSLLNSSIADDLQVASGFTDWRKVPLITHLCTGEVPAIVHHNGDKSLREKLWSTLWFTRHWQQLLAVLHARAQYDPMFNDASAFTEMGQKLPWQGMCQALEVHIFSIQLSHWPPLMDPAQ